MFLDQHDGGRPVFLFTGRVGHHRDQLAELLPGVDYDVRSAEWSLRELQRLKTATSGKWSILQAAGIDVAAVSVHVALNRVEVALVDSSGEDRSRVRALDQRLVVMESPELSLDCYIRDCPSSKGGISIKNEYSSTGWYCTSGYVAKWTKDNGTYEWVLVTAGHCIDDYPGWSDWCHESCPSEALGTEAQGTHGFHDSTSTYGYSEGDVGFVRLSGDGIPGDKNRVLLTADGSIGNITSFGWFSDQYGPAGEVEGAQVCRIGRGSYSLHLSGSSLAPFYKGRKCGTITLYDSDSDGQTNANSKSCNARHPECFIIANMKVVSFDSTGGDSGGVVFEKEASGVTNVRLFGTHVHSQADSQTANRGWYTPYTLGRIELGQLGATVNACLNDTCSNAP